jgi:hypothetical protein
MPRPIAAALRRALRRRWQQGQDAPTIAAALGLAERTVRRFLRRLRQQPSDNLESAYPRADPARPAAPLQEAAVQMRRDHPTWGAALIRVLLGHDFPDQPLPGVRTLQRWLARAGRNPAPRGRRPRAERRRALHPHDVWQMDAAELIRLASGQQVSWLRLVDEHTGAVLQTAVFPPGPLVFGRSTRCANRVAAGVSPLGTARVVPGGQRRPVGVQGGPADRPGAVAVGDGRSGTLQPSAVAAE